MILRLAGELFVLGRTFVPCQLAGVPEASYPLAAPAISSSSK
jgi:hypothetical protein